MKEWKKKEDTIATLNKSTWLFLLKEQTSGFAWAFASNKDGSPIEEYKSFVERLKLSPLEKDGYRYSLSKDGKFLQRTKVKGSD
jgi:hypothetical protein